MYRTAVLIRHDTKYPQLNPLTTQQEQDVVDWCLDISPCYAADLASLDRVPKKHGLFYLHCRHPGLFLFLTRSWRLPLSLPVQVINIRLQR